MRFKCIAKDYGSPMIHVIAYCRASCTGIADLISEEPTRWLLVFENRNWQWCIEEEIFLKHGRKVLDSLENPEFFSLVNKKSREFIDLLKRKILDYRERDWSKCSNEELASAFEELYESWVEMNTWGHLPNVVDFDHYLFSSQLTELLEKRINDRNVDLTVAEAFAVLTMPLEKSPLMKQEEDFFKLVRLIQQDSSATNSIKSHALEYDWLQFQYDGPVVLDEAYFIELIDSEIKQGIDAEKKLLELREKTRETQRKQVEYAELLGLTEKDSYWFEVARVFSFLKLLRKDVVFQASCWTRGLFTEISKRIGLDEIQVRHLTLSEVKQALMNGFFDSALARERVKFSSFLINENGDAAYVGDEALKLKDKIIVEETDFNVKELHGSPASPGTARGHAKIVNKASDMAKMKPGDVLVSHATNPNLVPAMKKASAILTDEGGITCHAAIVSRELGIPCI
ncbi:MAG: PEP-utilizing enzyme, partial [Candidatus Micrarchaeota archaeon]